MVVTSDGITLSVTDVGPRDARACIFIHGIAQSKKSWEPLLAGPLANTHRLVAFDLRGHGESDKPTDVSLLARSRLALDLAAIMTELKLDRPSVVAWSYGGVVVGEYLRQYGEKALGGIVYAAGAIRTGRDSLDFYGPTMRENGRFLISEDLTVYAAGARAFLQGCSALALPPEMLDRAVNEMLLVPAVVRRALLSGSEDYAPEVARTTIPMFTIHGARDTVVLPAMSALIATLRPGIGSLTLPNVGHLPWIEDPAAFEQALLTRRF